MESGFVVSMIRESFGDGLEIHEGQSGSREDGWLEFKISSEIPGSKVFQVLSAMKASQTIEEFSVTRTTLE